MFTHFTSDQCQTAIQCAGSEKDNSEWEGSGFDAKKDIFLEMETNKINSQSIRQEIQM